MEPVILAKLEYDLLAQKFKRYLHDNGIDARIKSDYFPRRFPSNPRRLIVAEKDYFVKSLMGLNGDIVFVLEEKLSYSKSGLDGGGLIGAIYKSEGGDFEVLLNDGKVQLASEVLRHYLQ